METTLITQDTNTTSSEIPSLLVPMAAKPLLLPTVSVAEMLPFREPELDGAYPAWYLGKVLWRGIMIPMISYEALNGGEVAPTKAVSQMAVLNSTTAHPKLPFIVLPTQGIPRLSRVTEDTIVEDNNAQKTAYDKMHTLINGEPAIIPNIAALEQVCIGLLGL